MAFIPIQVLIVTVIINELIASRERRSMLKKMNMVIGAFFSEMGMELLKRIFRFDSSNYDLKDTLLIDNKWTHKDFSKAINFVKNYNYSIDSMSGNIKELKIFLSEKRAFLLTMLANPNLLEHLSFTDLLWSISHLTQELELRKDLNNLNNLDSEHLSEDIRRAYSILIVEWIAYLKHLKEDYPFSYSLAIRNNPFNELSSIELK
jgi:hypothetical protein